MVKMLQSNEWKYLTFGKGKKVIVVLPNILLFPQEWFFYAKKLGSQYKIIVPVYPHIGDYDDMIDSLHEFLTQLKITHFSFIGNSVGGLLAQGYTARYPKGVTKVFLLATIAQNKLYGILTLLLCAVGLLAPQILIQRFAYWATEKSLIATKENQTYWIPQFRQHIFTHLSKDYFLSLGQCIAKFCLFNRYIIPSAISLTTIDSEGDIVFFSLFTNLARVYPKATHYSVRGGLHLVELNKKKDLLAILRKNL